MSQALETEPWDHTYKGDSYWLEVRRQVNRLCDETVAVHYDDIRADLWFQKELPNLDTGRGIDTAQQWERARRQHLIRARPKALEDTSDFVEFFVESRGGSKWFLARIDEMHCAAEVAATKENVSKTRKAQVVRRLRDKYHALDDAQCARCKRDLARLSQ
jgi:hypothetical protein